MQWPIIGHEKIQKYLIQSIIEDRIAPTYLFYGPESVGKGTTALLFAQSIICSDKNNRPCNKCENCQKYLNRSHPDVSIIEKSEDKKNISIEEIREKVVHRHHMSSFYSKYQITIIKDADSLSLEAANSLLKTLEEPSSESLIILIAKRLEALPKTVSSRCQTIEFNIVSNNSILDYLESLDPDTNRQTLKKLAQLSSGKPGLAWKLVNIADELDLIKEENQLFFEILNENIYSRFNHISQMLGSSTFMESSKDINLRINRWLTLLRDMLLNNYQLNGHQINSISEELFNKSGKKLTSKKISLMINELLEIKKMLTLNVNSRLALENFFLKI